MNTVHLFFNSAKSSQSGNKKDNRKVLGVIEPYFFCSSSINSQDLWLPSFQNVTPFKSYIILPICSRYLLQKSCHNGILPTWVLISLLYDLTVYLRNHLWNGNETWIDGSAQMLFIFGILCLAVSTRTTGFSGGTPENSIHIRHSSNNAISHDENTPSRSRGSNGHCLSVVPQQEGSFLS